MSTRSTSGSPRLLENQSLSSGHWIGLRLEGKYCNRDAYGAKVQVKAGESTWTREVRTTNGLYSASDPRLLFGLGDAAEIDEVVVRWPGGATQVEKRLPVDRYHVIREHAEGTR